MALIDRIDIALQHAGASRQDLATALGITVQAISNLVRRRDGVLRPENVAHAARWLHCDVYWLCTGEGGAYVPATPPGSNQPPLCFLAYEAGRFIDAMPEPDKARAFALVYRMAQGHWPVDPPAHAPVSAATTR